MIQKIFHTKKTILNFYLLQKIFILNIIKCLKINNLKFKIVKNTEIEIISSQKYIFMILYYLKNNALTRCETLSDIIAADFIKHKNRFLINYLLLSIFNYRIRVVTKISEFKNILSVVSLFNSSLWCEREIFDFFGIFFIYNQDLRRILTDYGFKGFPLRKDFPLSGYIELYYDDNEKKIIFKKIEFTQEFKHFSLQLNKTIWH